MLTITENKRGFRFEIAFDDDTKAWLEFRWLKGDMQIMSTLVPALQRGRGIGNKLVEYAFNRAAHHGYKIKAFCPFAQLYITKHPEVAHLVVQ